VGASLILGGARSGKSRYAQRMAEAAAATAGRRPVYVATGESRDAEMAQRIATHRAERGDRWTSLEAPVDLAGALRTLAAEDVAVVDCLTLWLSNSMLAVDDHHETRLERLPAAIAACPARLWLVSNEVGWGIVPDNALARRFRDEAGQLHQRVAEMAQEVVLVVAGLPLVLKPAPA
jgi:adenosylcobinamide kinase / adenosylcobinamide-phosphate guanylyltransferase